MAYLYASNVSPRDGFSQIDLQMDNGRKLTMRLGGVYDLSATELVRARRYIVLTSSSSPSINNSVQYLPVKGVLNDGDVPVWDESEGAFIPGTGGGGGGGGGGSSSATYVWNDATSQYELKADAKSYVGPVPPPSVGITMEFGDTFTPSEEPS
jgi:hypothetical protein